MIDWQAIVREHGPAVWRTAYRVVGNRADTEECFQEAFLGAVQIARGQHVKNWRALLQRLAASRAIDRLRQRYRQEHFEGAVEFGQFRDPAPPPCQAAEDKELSERLRRLLVQLPSKQAEAFCLHCLDECSYQEIGEQMGVSVNAVGVLLYRARERLRELLADLVSQPENNLGRSRPEKEPS
ncbi:hypothetical protein AYO40_04755 [Planctomycetaceae bacterium SCGC AG-212-D15]|nr:hypothetical protein AYO40_04755 [Planctomycetaceae bacterium SCGC AG-212-D15]